MSILLAIRSKGGLHKLTVPDQCPASEVSDLILLTESTFLAQFTIARLLSICYLLLSLCSAVEIVALIMPLQK